MFIVMDKISTKGSMIEQLDISRVPRSGFDMSHHNFLAGKLGAIIPTRVEEVLPGDRIKGDTHIVTNFEPMAVPMMSNMVQKEETFFVPADVLWDKADRFFTGKKGFSDNIPSMTIPSIFDKLKSGFVDTQQPFVLEPSSVLSFSSDSTLSNRWLLSYSTLTNAIRSLRAAYEGSFVQTYGVVDLVEPCYKRLNSDYSALVSVLSSYHAVHHTYDTPITYTGLVDALAQLCGDLMNFWLGPSSQLDYLGVYHRDFVPVCKEILNNYVNNGTSQTGFTTLADYLPSIPFNWLPVRASYWIWYWNYRDQILEADAYDPEEYMSGSTISDFELFNCLLVRQRCWFKDTFTTALDNTGDANIIVPTTLDAGTYSGNGFIEVTETPQDLSHTSDVLGATDAGNFYSSLTIGGVTYRMPSRYLFNESEVTGGTETFESSNGVSLSLLDRARRLSSWVSKRLVLGTEYDDVVYSSFMVKLSNVRMHIPELLASGRTQVSMNVVVNNTSTEQQIAGDKSGIAYSDNYDSTSDVNYFAEQHGYILSYLTIMPIQSYPNGLQRMYLRQNRFDFAWPEFAQLGMDAIYNCELTGLSGATTNDFGLAIFGYQGRYYDYKSRQDECHGRMLTDWNMYTFGRFLDESDNVPVLNRYFVHCWPRLSGFVVDDDFEDIFRSDVHFRYAWERCLPVPSEILR